MPEFPRDVGRYELLREIGRGGMATVYLARQTGLDRDVALKELAGFHQPDPAFARRFERESRLIASLSHPNVVAVYDYFTHEGVPFIAMEYVDRGSLRPYVTQLRLAQAVGVLEGLLAGLAHAETRGIVHRDLKPENVMLTADGRVKIADFGIAKAIGGAASGLLTATGMTVGTPLYMAPEQAMAQGIGPWTDLYSLGAIAYEMLCGRPPITGGDSPMAILLRVLNEQPVAPRTRSPSLDPALSDWVMRLLAKDPAKRTRSAMQAWDELEEIVISAIGPRWRRQARMRPAAESLDTPRPLTPAPFESGATRTPTPGAQPAAPEPEPPPPVTTDDYDSFALDRLPGPWPAPDSAERPQPGPEDRDRPPPAATEPAPPEEAPEPDAKGELAEDRDAPTVAPAEVLPTRPPEPAHDRERAPAGATPKAPARRRAVLIAVATALCGAGGYLLAPSRSTTAPPPALAQTVRSDALELSYPRGFRPVAAPARPALRAPAAVVADRGGAVVVAGIADAAGPTLLPAELARRLGASLPVATAVGLGELEAKRYAVDGLRVYAVATSAGVATVICDGSPAALRALAGDCERIASSLTLRRSTPHPAGPSRGYARALTSALRTLARARRAGLDSMRSARTRRGQAAGAGAVRRAYASVAASLRAVALGAYDARANRRLVAALANAGDLYDSLASAARAGDAAAYARRCRALAPAERAVGRAIRDLGALGYAVAG